jgi:hypothetical protein
MDATFRRAPDRDRRTLIRRPLLLLLALPLLMAADPPASQPSTQIKEWFNQLSDARPEIRSQAIDKLMALPDTQLLTLREVVEQSRPLSPSQSVALRDIVTQVYLSGQPYEAVADGGGFLGLIWPPFPAMAVMEDDSEPGVVVRRRVPGTPAYAALREGDVILKVREISVDPETFKRTFTDLVKPFRAGDTLTMQIMRDGRLMTLPITLKPRPANLTGEGRLEAWMAERRDRADEYWNQTFRPLVGDDQVL